MPPPDRSRAHADNGDPSGHPGEAHSSLTDGSTRSEPPYADEFSLLDLAAVFLRYRWTIIVFVLAVPVVMGLVTILSPERWTATASFMPQDPADAGRSRLMGLAGQFGIELGGSEAGHTPQFYAQLVRSREILGPVAVDTFAVADSTGLFARGRVSGTLVEILGLDADADRPELRRAAALRWLRDESVSVSTDAETGVVTVSSTTPWPGLSAQIVDRIIELISQFNLETRQSQAASERQFIEGRVEESGADLREAEDALQGFLQNNRAFQNSPELTFEHDRLQRRVAMRQQVYTTLMESYEQARIAEVRNTPVITVVEPAEEPVMPDSKLIAFKVLLGMMLGAIAGMVTALGREVLRRHRDEEGEIEEVAALWKETKADFKRFTPPFRRRA